MQLSRSFSFFVGNVEFNSEMNQLGPFYLLNCLFCFAFVCLLVRWRLLLFFFFCFCFFFPPLKSYYFELQVSLSKPFLAWNNSNDVLVLCLAQFWHFEVQFHNRLVLTMEPSTIPFYYEAMQCGVYVLYLGFPHMVAHNCHGKIKFRARK